MLNHDTMQRVGGSSQRDEVGYISLASLLAPWMPTRPDIIQEILSRQRLHRYVYHCKAAHRDHFLLMTRKLVVPKELGAHPCSRATSLCQQ